MAVLAEMHSVIIRRDAIVARYRGGWKAFVRSEPNRTMCADPFITRVGFMGAIDLVDYIDAIDEAGICLDTDVAVTSEPEGLGQPTPWLGWGSLQRGGVDIAAAWFIDAGQPRWPQRLVCGRRFRHTKD
jgi:hypothetical protein